MYSDGSHGVRLLASNERPALRPLSCLCHEWAVPESTRRPGRYGLEHRERALAALHAGLEAGLAAAAGLPRVLNLEAEYVAATSAAQLAWLRSVIAHLRAGRLAWSEQELLATALGDAQAAQAGK